MSASDELNHAWSKLQAEIEVNEVWHLARQKRGLALQVLSTIPSGTSDEDLTPEQQQAWMDYEEADSVLRTSNQDTRGE